jgi:predicted acyl esterase
MKIEKDVDIPMRDGAKLKADVFRPDGDGHFPVLINMGIYQKDKLWIPPPDLEEKPNPHMNWETVNPEWWVPRGYCCVRVDERGSGKSPGQSVLYSPQEAIDFYDAIEWAGHQPWSNGRVATIGISFFARTQWWVANLKPPSLTCIVPWEGAADQYRDILYHGGVFGSGFIVGWFTTHMAHHLLGRAYRNNPDTFQDNVLWRFMRNSLDSGVFKSQQAQWDKSIFPCGRSVTGPAWGCTCAAPPRLTCAPPRSTKSCASIAARIITPSTARMGGATNFASSTTGSRTSTTA